MVDRGGEFSFFLGIRVRIDIRIDIFISMRPMTAKFGTSARFDSNETDQAGAVLLQDHVTN